MRNCSHTLVFVDEKRKHTFFVYVFQVSFANGKVLLKQQGTGFGSFNLVLAYTDDISSLQIRTNRSHDTMTFLDVHGQHE